jgi:hypothetical protein
VPPLVCAHCGNALGPDDGVDVLVSEPQPGVTHFKALSDNARAVMADAMVTIGIEIETVAAHRLIDTLNGVGMVVARRGGRS